MSNFIQSILLNIIPNNIILTTDENSNRICLDGKQRITSLVQFKNNEFSVEYDNDILFYNEIPDDCDNDKCRIMTKEERWTFMLKNIPVVEYSNLSYEDQVNIFERMQNGKALSCGELVPALFKNDKLGEKFNKYCDRHTDILYKFEKNERQDHRILITNIMYMINKKLVRVPDKLCRGNYLKSLNDFNKLQKNVTRIENLITFCFSEKLLGHPSISKNIYKKLLLMFIFVIDEKYKLDDDNKIKNREYTTLRNALNISYVDMKKKYSKVKNDGTENDMQEMRKLIISNIKKEKDNISEESYSDDESYDEESSEEFQDGSIYEEYIAANLRKKRTNEKFSDKYDEILEDFNEFLTQNNLDTDDFELDKYFSAIGNKINRNGRVLGIKLKMFK
jgi:hypothetical protein